MIRAVLTVLTPPIAACRFGCAGCCAAPIAVFWLTGIVSIIYGITGGPAHLMGTSWYTVGLGLAMWAIAAVWTALTIHSSNEEKCAGKKTRLCSSMTAEADESDPFEEVRKAR